MDGWMDGWMDSQVASHLASWPASWPANGQLGSEVHTYLPHLPTNIHIVCLLNYILTCIYTYTHIHACVCPYMHKYSTYTHTMYTWTCMEVAAWIWFTRELQQTTWLPGCRSSPLSRSTSLLSHRWISISRVYRVYTTLNPKP